MMSVTVEIIFYRAPLSTLVLEIEPKLKETTANVFVDGSMGVMVSETTRHSCIGSFFMSPGKTVYSTDFSPMCQSPLISM